jgi:hypothetical protein
LDPVPINDRDPQAPSDVVLFASPVAVGHVRPLMPLAKRLVTQGVPVVWAISGDDNEPASAWRQPLSDLGVQFVDLDATAKFVRGRTDEFGPMQLFRRLLGRANDVAAPAAEAIRVALDGRRVRCGVYDFFGVWSYVAMRRLGIEHIVTVISAFPTLLDSIGAAFPSLVAPAEDPICQRELAGLRRAGFGAFDDAPRGGFVPRDPALEVVCFTSEHLCPEPPAGVELLGVAREALPQIDVTSAIPPEHADLVDQLRRARQSGARVVLLSMGTVIPRMFKMMGAAHVAFLKRLYTTVAAAALRSEAVVVASTGASSPADLGMDEATLGPASRDRVFALPFVPQPLLFAHGLVDVMLMHGGANTFHETVLSGIPTLVCPGFGDQEAVARAAARLGVGVCVESITYPNLDGAMSLAQVADDVLPAMLAPGNTQWKTEATRLAALIRQESGLARAEALLVGRRG